MSIDQDQFLIYSAVTKGGYHKRNLKTKYGRMG